VSELHQYQIDFREELQDVFVSRVELEWAYSAQDALTQFQSRIQAHHRKVMSPIVGAVKDAVKYRGPLHQGLHFHVCLACETTIAPCYGCTTPERGRSWEPCTECLGKKPHVHFCDLCAKEFPCPSNACTAPRTKEMTCSRHSANEITEFLRKKFGPHPAL
jgi:hypothetical protein